MSTSPEAEEQVVHQIASLAREPLLVHFVVIGVLTIIVTHRQGFGYELRCSQNCSAASNNFGPAITMVSTAFGIESDEALHSKRWSAH